MLNSVFHKIIVQWQKEKNWGSLVPIEKTRPEVTLPLRDDSGRFYQIHIQGRYFCLSTDIQVIEFHFEGGQTIVSKRNVIRSSLPALKLNLNKAVSTIRGWMSENGATCLSENARPMRC